MFDRVIGKIKGGRFFWDTVYNNGNTRNVCTRNTSMRSWTTRTSQNSVVSGCCVGLSPATLSTCWLSLHPCQNPARTQRSVNIVIIIFPLSCHHHQLWSWWEVVAAHHRVHDYACCHLQADCLESGISSGLLRSITSMENLHLYLLHHQY